MLLKKYIPLLLLLILSVSVFAQEPKKDVNSLTRNDVLEMNIEELSDYDLEEIMKLMDIVGASTIEELYELLLNKDVTSASKSAESVFDSPLSTTVLSHDQIISSGATCIEEALRLVPGVIVREKTNGNFDVHIRGNDNIPGKNMLLYSENMNTLVMINGRPVFNYSHGGTLWETLPVSFEDIDRIEVVRGPSSALYGPNAVSGVINIITQEITTESPLVSGNVQGGSLNSYIGDIAFRKSLNNKLSVGITANYEVRDRENDKILIYNGEDAEGNLLYTLNGTPVGTDYYSKAEIEKLQKDGLYIWPPYTVKGEVYDVNKSFPSPDQSKDRKAVNGYITFTPAQNTSIHLMGGFQNSEALTSTMGDMPTPFSTKIAKTSYIDLRANINKLSLQANYNTGDIDYMAGNEGFELDNKQFTAQAEYNFEIGNLEVRPGASFQTMTYDDSEHISEMGKGYLNGKSNINILAGSLRLDYKPTDKLRLVAALRTEKYNYPEDLYTSWQLVGSYKINENNIFRAVYSRANQSSFIVNTYSNYTWNIVNRAYPRVIQFDGNKDYDLMTTDMFELGYRVRPSKNVLIDFEAFYNMSSNYGALMPDYTSVNIYNTLAVLSDPNQSTMPIAVPDSVHIMYNNLDLTSKQLGASINIDWVINEKLVANAHLTVQKTKLDHYLAYSRDELIAELATDATIQTIGGIIYKVQNGLLNPADIPSIVNGGSSAIPADLKDNYEHKSTPNYFGGFSLTYRPTKKLEIFPQAYFYSEQSFENQYGTIDISSKFLLNAKVSYKATDNFTLYLNGRNILNQKSAEFAFMDENPMMILGGIHFKF